MVTIPASGRLKVRDVRLLDSWHQESAAFASGARIPTPTEPGGTGMLATNIVGLRGGGATHNGGGRMVTWYFVGTQQEVETADELKP